MQIYSLNSLCVKSSCIKLLDYELCIIYYFLACNSLTEEMTTEGNIENRRGTLKDLKGHFLSLFLFVF